MNISYKWLKEYVGFELNPDELAAMLTSIGLETGSVEKVESIRGGLAGIVIGKVLTCAEHPDSDHLHITTVDLEGNGNPTQIVCGAPNVAAGQCVVVATVGTTLYAPDGSEFKIKKSKIRGVESFGMICAEDEIGLGHAHDGIIVLPAEAEAMVGRPASEYFGIEDDYVLEVDLTPNRIDAASHYGVARDLAAALTGREIAAVKASMPEAAETPRTDAGNPVKVDVQDADGCTRYCGVTIEGVKIEESPEWLRNRLTTIGLHPINNVVDITNYILHGIGQPLHAFDADTLRDNSIVVRRADKGFRFTSLDGVEHELDSADLMICDSTEPKCIAGVFGGLDSGVTEKTSRVFLESACFNPTSVRRTARRHGISTDSSFRFERGVDPNGCMRALRIAAGLICELAGGKIAGEATDFYPAPVAAYPVDMHYGDFGKLIGAEFDRATIDNILKALEIEIVPGEGDSVHLDVPTYRTDVRRPCDVIEDFLRIYGYNKVAMSNELHGCLSFKTTVDACDDLRRTVAEQLTGAGWTEILNNSLTARSYYEENPEYTIDSCVSLLNPLSQDLSLMRRTLLYGGLESIAHNANRRNPDVAFYEFGNVYKLDPSKTSTPEAPLAPYSENFMLGMWMSGASRSANWLRAREDSQFYDLKANVMNVLARTGLPKSAVVLAPSQTVEGGIFAQALDINTVNGKTLGRMGVVSPAICRKADIKAPVFYAELNWDAVAELAAKTNALYTPLPKTQPVKRDLSLLIDSKVSMADIENAVRQAERKLLRSVELFDVYEGEHLPAGKKSYAISITLQDDEKTLQDKHIDKMMSKIIDTLKNRLGAELR
ncbi:MAG: phenylalanine--tRNA ligase subunit beta [Muribaculaceae bacterium]|nr:phenylalanine--tRNA ligase subunit beta [Muribaculaceae bacterium]